MPPILLHPPKPPRAPTSQFRRATRRRQLRRGALRLVVLVTLVLLGWGAWYLANRGFGRTYRAAVTEELRKRGVEATIRRLTLDPWRGLVAQDVRIYDFKNRDHPLAEISEIALDLNYAALLHRQPFLNALDIRGADVTFPSVGGDTAAPPVQLRELRARVMFPPEQIYIRQAEGVFGGVRISATGQLIKRADYKPQRDVTEDEWRQRIEIFQRVGQELAQFRFPGEPPTLQVKFSGDLAKMEEARVDATLRGELLLRGGYEMRDLLATAEWTEQRLHVRQLVWRDPAGEFHARGSWNAVAAQAEFQAQSTIQLKQFLEAFGYGHYVAEAAFTTPPQLQLTGSLDFSTGELQRRLTGRAELGGFSFRAVPFTGLATDFSWDGSRTMLRGLRLRHESGELLGDLLDAPETFRATIESTINPAAFRPLLPKGAANFVGEWEFPRSPAIRLSVNGASRNPQSWTADGTVALQRTRFRGVWMNSASANVRLADGAIAFTDLRLARPEGTGTGAFTYDFRNGEVRVENVRTSLRPQEAIYWIEPKLQRVIAPYKFRAAPNLVANGTVTLRGRRGTQLEIAVDAAGGMDYDFLGKTLPFDRLNGQLLITDGRVQLQQTEAALFGGTIRGAADVRFEKPNDHYSATIIVEGVEFPRLTNLYFGYKTSQGLLDGRYEFALHHGDARTMRGNGSLRVSNGNVFAIPVFGPLSKFLGSVFPGSGYSIAKTATATFTIADGVIHTDDLDVAGKLFSMRGRGDIHFLDDRLDMDVRIEPKGAGALLSPVYKLFEYKGEGSLKDPKWRAKNF